VAKASNSLSEHTFPLLTDKYVVPASDPAAKAQLAQRVARLESGKLISSRSAVEALGTAK
jgi:hypothetical protein